MIATQTDRILCHCLRVTEGQVRATVDALGSCSLRDVMKLTGAGRGCMSCHARIRAVLSGQPLPPAFVVPPCSGCCNPACACAAEAADRAGEVQIVTELVCP